MLKAPIFILGLLCSFTLEIISLSFDNIVEVLIAINYKGMIIKPSILAFKIKPLFILLLYGGAGCITFIFTNFNLFLYIILVYIFVKCLLTNLVIRGASRRASL